MNLSNLDFFFACSWPLVLVFCIWQRRAGHEQLAWETAYATLIMFLVFDVVNLIVYLHDRDWVNAGIWLVNLAVTAWMLHRGWRDKRRRKITDALGAKSRALREKLVEKMRGTAPHPVPVRA